LKYELAPETTMATVTELLERRCAVPPVEWGRFFDLLAARRLPRSEVAATLSAFCAHPPDPTLVAGLTMALRERQGPQTERISEVVNIVGTGGGPATFNISTAAAITAAAAGIKVVKSGSRAFTSRHGSQDLLDRLGVETSPIGPATRATLERIGVVFARADVYPAEFVQLARAMLPGGIRAYGRFFNLVGPFVADVPATRQLTGVSDRDALGAAIEIARSSGRLTWLVTNDVGADELIPFAQNTIHVVSGNQPGSICRSVSVGPEDFPTDASTGSLGALAPVDDIGDAAADFCDVLEGISDPSRTAVVAANAAALSLLAEDASTWADAYKAAVATLRNGDARNLLRKLTDSFTSPIVSQEETCHV
jgi:anthranilate phosphoribosyltransferase